MFVIKQMQSFAKSNKYLDCEELIEALDRNDQLRFSSSEYWKRDTLHASPPTLMHI